MLKPLVAILILALCAEAQAARIAVVADPSYVDATSASSLETYLDSQGHSASAFTGIDSAAFQGALASADLILFPQDIGSLASVLSTSAATVIRGFVNSGGGMISVGDGGEAIFLPVFNFGFASSGTPGVAFRDDTVVAGTPYAGGPASASAPAAESGGINGFFFMPPGGLQLYRDQIGGFPNSALVMTAPYGEGGLGFLGWGFQSWNGQATTSGNWSDILDIMVDDLAAASVPTPPVTWLLGLGALALVGSRRHLAV